jgi:5,10-methylenetetrahydromethanopterin reductase
MTGRLEGVPERGIRFGFVGGVRAASGFVSPEPPLPDEVERWTEHVERLGASLLSFGEGQTLWEDPYIHLAAAARASTSLLLGPNVTAPFIRHPTVLANTMSTLQRLSAGRAFLGIGTGLMALAEIGRNRASVDALAAYASAVRALCAGEEAEYEGERLRLQWTAGPVPLWLAAEGPRILGRAGRIADGIIVGNGAAPSIVRHVLRHAGAGAEAAGRSVDELDVWFLVRIEVAESEEAAIGTGALGSYAARYARHLMKSAVRPGRGSTAEQLLQNKGIEVDADLAGRLERFDADFVASDGYDRDSANAELLDAHGLRRWVTRQFLVAGSHDEVVGRLRELVAAGARNFIVPQVNPATAYESSPQVAAVFAEVAGSPA